MVKMKKRESELMIRSGNQAVYVTGKLARTVAVGMAAMLLMFGIAALVEAGNNRINSKKLNA
jgi:hypothetical protein